MDNENGRFYANYFCVARLQKKKVSGSDFNLFAYLNHKKILFLWQIDIQALWLEELCGVWGSGTNMMDCYDTCTV